MPTITKESARQHCRTCFGKLSNDHTRPVRDEQNLSVDGECDIKSIAINVVTNENLKLLMEQYIEMSNEPEWMGADEFPQHVCLGCYNKLQGFDKFRQLALVCSATLRTLFSGGGVTKVEVDEIVDETEIANENIYSTMLKDALMETETVVLMEHADISAFVSCELQTPDPFSTENINKVEKKEKKLIKQIMASSAVSDDGVDHYNDNENLVSSNSSEEDTPLSQLRSSATQKSHRYKPRKKGTKNSYRCEQCNRSFAHKLTRDAHVRKVHEGSKRPYQCDRCDKSYTFFGGLWKHIREIHETEKRSYPCEYAGCDKIYTRQIAMQKHRREEHLGLISSKIYVCELCGITYNQMANLKNHRRRKHPMETGVDSTMKEESKERVICSICNKQFQSRYTLKNHVLEMHSTDLKFECNVCGRRMAKKFRLVQHMRIHALDRLPCNHCEKQFIRKQELDAHVRAVHLKIKPHGCQYCPEKFACRKTLRHHEYIHTGEKPYLCDICGQAYRQKPSLKAHRKSHETMTPEMLLSKNINTTLKSFLGSGAGGSNIAVPGAEVDQQQQQTTPQLQ